MRRSNMKGRNEQTREPKKENDYSVSKAPFVNVTSPIASELQDDNDNETDATQRRIKSSFHDLSEDTGSIFHSIKNSKTIEPSVAAKDAGSCTDEAPSMVNRSTSTEKSSALACKTESMHVTTRLTRSADIEEKLSSETLDQHAAPRKVSVTRRLMNVFQGMRENNAANNKSTMEFRKNNERADLDSVTSDDKSRASFLKRIKQNQLYCSSTSHEDHVPARGARRKHKEKTDKAGLCIAMCNKQLSCNLRCEEVPVTCQNLNKFERCMQEIEISDEGENSSITNSEETVYISSDVEEPANRASQNEGYDGNFKNTGGRNGNGTHYDAWTTKFY